MSLALGIDTGGTYTDAVVIEYETGRVVAAAKSLTTKHDLTLGITRAIDGVALDPHEIGLVSLSTTLATNALVEGQGAPVGAILIGYGGHIAPETDLCAVLNTPYVALVSGGHDSGGRELAPLDLAGAEQAVRALDGEVAAFAISGFFGARNPEHELAVRDLVRRLTHKPVTCGHELSSRLDALRRATTVALNASLIPLVCDLLDAVSTALAERGISAPLMVVKGDGSLISAKVARERPVETILSGPAASVVGALALGGQRDAVVVDMGGTTTDIAIVRDGNPTLSAEGATVGRWRTMVEAIDVYTCGLGGDSQVWRDERGALQIGPSRVVPISVLTSVYPEIMPELRAQWQAPRQPGDGEFYVLQHGPWPSTLQSPPFEAALQEALLRGPVSAAQLREIMAHPGLYDRYLHRLLREGLVIRAGLTPTDCAHVLGWYREWDVEAANLAAALLARRLGLERDELCRKALARAVELGAHHAVRAILASEDPEHPVDGSLDALLRRALGPGNGSLLHLGLRVNRPVVAIGAPAGTYWPRSGELLAAPVIVPEHAQVANAVGAVAGSVVVRQRAQVTPSEDSVSFIAFVPGERREFGSAAEAIEYATVYCSDRATASALAAGAATVQLNTARHDHSAPVGLGEDDTYLFTEITVTAAGRPALVHESALPA
ncbi:MAG: hydantoinase/oxoprolinase family protein [Anaerolineales bacterium]